MLLLIAAALVPIDAGDRTIPTKGFVDNVTGAETNLPERPRDEDLALYDRVIERIRGGEHYYDFIAAEHRAAHYPVTPGFAVRLPTLAYLDAWLGVPGQIACAVLLMIAVLLAWWRRLGDEPGGEVHKPLVLALLFMGASLGLNRYYFVLHELWAGMLLALAFGLHRVRRNPPPPGEGDRREAVVEEAPQAKRDPVAAPPPSAPGRLARFILSLSKGAATSPGRGGSWLPSLLVAALALAIREHALPFVLLMAAMAFWRRDWREGAAWSLLAALFLVALKVHLDIVAAQVLPGDQPSSSWLALRGLSGWLSTVVLSSNLRFLPHWLAGPAVVLMMAGWAGWRSPAGVFATFLFLGYGLAFGIAGRPDNFYWGAMIAPAMFMGLAFAPRAVRSLASSAFAPAK